MVNLLLPHPVYHSEVIICFQEKLLSIALEAQFEDFKPWIKRIKIWTHFFHSCWSFSEYKHLSKVLHKIRTGMLLMLNRKKWLLKVYTEQKA